MLMPTSVAFVVVICSIKSNRCEKLNTHLVISAYSSPLAPIGDGTSNNLGLMEKDIIDLLAESLNFTYEVRAPEDVMGVGLYENGSWTGMIGQLVRKEVDLGTLGELTISKYDVIDATVYITQDHVNILIHYPKLNVSNKAALVEIFSNLVWAGIVLSTAIVITAFWILARMKLKSDATIIEITLYIYGLLMGQRDYQTKKSQLIRLICGFWCVGMLVLVSIYKGTLTSLLTAPKYKFVVNTAIDIGRNEDIMPHVRRSSSSHDFIMNSHLESLKPIKERLSKHPRLLLGSNDDYLSLLARGQQNVLISSDQLLKALIYDDYKSKRKCRFTLAKETVYTRKQSLLLQKNSPFTKTLDLQILRMHAAGLTNFIEKKYVPASNPCTVQQKQKRSKLTKITFNQLSGAFLVLLVCLSVSAVVFVIEVIVHKYMNSNQVVQMKRLNRQMSCLCRQNVSVNGRFSSKRRRLFRCRCKSNSVSPGLRERASMSRLRIL